MTASRSPFDSWRLGPILLRNRFIKAATNEGLTPSGDISEPLIEFHRAMAAGGVGMSTLAYCAVSPDGRTFEDQAVLKPEFVPGFRKLTDAIHAQGAAACAQITHGGAFNFLQTLEEHPRPVSADGGFNPPGLMAGRWFKRRAEYSDLTLLRAQFVAAARCASEAGFDAVELHLGHGYLLSQFLSPAYNHRQDQYGGPAENRAKFPAEVLAAVLDAVGSKMAVLCKLSVDEGHARGSTLDDVAKICRTLENAGAHMLVLSAGMNVESPWTIFGSRLPMRSMTAAASGLFKPLSALMALRQPRKAFSPLYLLPKSRQIRREVSMPLCYLGGVTALAQADSLCAEGFEAFAMGRALIHQPDLIEQWRSGDGSPSGCTACNLCIAQMYGDRGTHCVLTGGPAKPRERFG